MSGRGGGTGARGSAAPAVGVGYGARLRPLVTGAERGARGEGASQPALLPPSLGAAAPPGSSRRGFGVVAGREPISAARLWTRRGWLLFPPAPVVGSASAAAGSGATSGRNPSGDAGLPRFPRGDVVRLKSRQSPAARAVFSFSCPTKVAAGEQVRCL